VQVHRDEGVAIRIGPKPCVGIREGDGEASVGEHAGQPLSRDRKLILGADAVCVAEGNMTECGMRALGQPSVVEEPGMHGRSLHGNREISGLPIRSTRMGRIGKAKSRSR
jgi:hypothetical protein